MTQYAISIIIPMYNVENYISKCLDSVLNQEFTDYEVIIINDGSTDGSLAIVNEYLTKHKNLNVINQSNSGQSAARNKGIEMSKGDYIYFLDSDDFIDSNAIGELYKESITNDLDLVIFNGDSFFDSKLKIQGKRLKSYRKKADYPDIIMGSLMFSKLILNKDYSCSPCLLFIKRDLIQNSRIRFLEGIIHEDELFTFLLFMKSERVKYVNKVYFHRRIRENSTMTGKNYVRSFIGYKTVYYEMLKFRDSIVPVDIEMLEAMNTKISYMYGGALNRFCSMKKKEKSIYRIEISELKASGKNNKYYKRIEYLLFYYSKCIYCKLRKMYDLFKAKRG